MQNYLHSLEGVYKDLIYIFHALFDLFASEIKFHENPRTFERPLASVGVAVFIRSFLDGDICLMGVKILRVLKIFVIGFIAEPGEAALVPLKYFRPWTLLPNFQWAVIRDQAVEPQIEFFAADQHRVVNVPTDHKIFLAKRIVPIAKKLVRQSFDLIQFGDNGDAFTLTFPSGFYDPFFSRVSVEIIQKDWVVLR